MNKYYSLLGFFLLLISNACSDPYNRQYDSRNILKARIHSPEDSALFTPGDPILIQASITGLNYDNMQIYCEFVSDKDGVLDMVKPSPNGEVLFQTTSLSKNSHIIYLITQDNDGFTSMDSIVINNVAPKATELVSIEKNENSIILNWNKSDPSNDFQSYSIYRSRSPDAFNKGTLISTISNIDSTTFEDRNILMDEIYFYQVVIQNNDGSKKASNERNITAGIYIDNVGYYSKMIYDPKSGFVYAGTNGITVIDPVSFKIVKKINLPVSDFDVNVSGKYIYIGYQKTITKISTTSNEIVNEATIGFCIRKIECGRNGIVYVLGCETNSEHPLLMYNSENGNYLDSYAYYGGVRVGDMEASPSGDTLYHGESNSSMTKIRLFDASSGKLEVLEEKEISWGSPYVKISSDGKFIYWNSTIFSKNLNSQINTDGWKVLEFGQNSSLAIFKDNIYNISTNDLIRSVPSRKYSHALFVNNDKELLLYHQNQNYNEAPRLFKYSLK